MNNLTQTSPTTGYNISGSGKDAIATIIVGIGGADEIKIRGVDINQAWILAATLNEVAEKLYEQNCDFRLVMTAADYEDGEEEGVARGQHIKPARGWHPGGKALCGAQPSANEEWASVIPQTAEFILSASDGPLICSECLRFGIEKGLFDVNI